MLPEKFTMEPPLNCLGMGIIFSSTASETGPFASSLPGIFMPTVIHMWT